MNSRPSRRAAADARTGEACTQARKRDASHGQHARCGAALCSAGLRQRPAHQCPRPPAPPPPAAPAGRSCCPPAAQTEGKQGVGKRRAASALVCCVQRAVLAVHSRPPLLPPPYQHHNHVSRGMLPQLLHAKSAGGPEMRFRPDQTQTVAPCTHAALLVGRRASSRAPQAHPQPALYRLKGFVPRDVVHLRRRGAAGHTWQGCPSAGASCAAQARAGRPPPGSRAPAGRPPPLGSMRS